MVGDTLGGQADWPGFEHPGDVLLVVPAAAEYLRLVRLTAAGLASRIGFTFDEVEDLRIAVDELCFLLLTDDDGPDDAHRRMELRYSAGQNSIAIEGSTRWRGRAPEPNDLSLQILAALVDDHAVTGADGEVRFRLLKRREEP